MPLRYINAKRCLMLNDYCDTDYITIYAKLILMFRNNTSIKFAYYINIIIIVMQTCKLVCQIYPCTIIPNMLSRPSLTVLVHMAILQFLQQLLLLCFYHLLENECRNHLRIWYQYVLTRKHIETKVIIRLVKQLILWNHTSFGYCTVKLTY